MGTLKIVAVVALLTAPVAATAQVVAWRPYVIEASDRFDVPGAWIERVMRLESGGRIRIGGRSVVSSAGAIGLMQLMPTTWAAMRDLAGLGSDPFDPHDNIMAGTLYLRLLYDRFGYPGLFAAYNAGPERYRLYLAGRRTLPGETVRYLTAASGAPAQARAKPTYRLPLRVKGNSSPSADTLFAIAPR